jgi:aminoglycoside phosphotransferase
VVSDVGEEPEATETAETRRPAGPAPELPEPAPEPPAPAPEPPAPVLALAAGRELSLVWDNEFADTYEIGSGADRCFVKWSTSDSTLDLGAEAERMAWAAAYTPVPRLLSSGSDVSGRWLVTSPLPGRNAVDPRWLAEPRTAVRAIGAGLRALHEALPVSSCPFSWTAQRRIEQITRAVADGWTGPGAEWHEEYQHLPLERAVEIVAGIPPTDKLVVCHGDACAPNTLLTDDGRWSGHVDLGCLGIGDRWADLAVATWSATWNYGPGWEDELLRAYGVHPDEDRTWYYRLLWDLG